MKFVHLTPQPSISRVKRGGIRTGQGRRGRGVYAVPLMLLPQIAYTIEQPYLTLARLVTFSRLEVFARPDDFDF